ncbi:unnamed protein product [Mytilus coruscus]|uniref:Uncharacterized protein n=1 Tax=Mytilus coruscus TaxID=42192 RepID=A0A6J8B4M0_MYTCO|nr:unnamed protein product [Mytilus coruscus]
MSLKKTKVSFFLTFATEITAYLDLAESANMIKSTIGQKVEEERQRPKSAGSEKGVHESHVVPPGEPLISMTSVKTSLSMCQEITAYLDLAESANMIKSTIGQKVEEERQRPKSKKGVHESHVVPPGEPLISMTSVKNLAVNVSRRNMIRKERYENQDEGDWY